MNDEALRHLVQERRRARERDADVERLAAQVRHAHRRAERRPTTGLALLLAARRHALQ
jgi:hypothetical protein